MIRKSVQTFSAYTPGEQPDIDEFVKLNTNENPYLPSPLVAQALSSIALGELRLYPDPMCVELRAAIAGMHNCDISQIFVGNGSDEILALCTRAFVENDGSIGYFEPSYSLYPVLVDIREVEKKPVALNSDFGWVMPDDYDCSLFLLTSPNAPTGLLYPKDMVRTFCERSTGVIVLDEAYVDFAREDAMDLAFDLDNVLSVRTLSKAYSLAGLRVGYAVGSADLVAALFKIKDSYNVNALSQALALASLSDIDHMRGNAAKIKITRQRLSETLSSMGFTVYPSESNFLWARPSGIGAKELFEYLKKRRILIRYFPGERTGAFVRITVGTDEDVDILIDAVRRY